MDMMTHLVAALSILAQLIKTMVIQVAPKITLSGKMKMEKLCVVASKM